MKQSGKPILVGSVVRNGCLVALAAAVVCNILFTEFLMISITRTRLRCKSVSLRTCCH